MKNILLIKLLACDIIILFFAASYVKFFTDMDRQNIVDHILVGLALFNFALIPIMTVALIILA